MGPRMLATELSTSQFMGWGERFDRSLDETEEGSVVRFEDVD